MTNRITKQAIVHPDDKFDATRITERLSLFNPDGTPFEGGGEGGADLRPFKAGAGTFIETAADGSNAFGYADATNSITANGKGTTAFGYAKGGNITAPYNAMFVGGIATDGGLIRSSLPPEDVQVYNDETYQWDYVPGVPAHGSLVFGVAKGTGSEISGNATGALVGGLALNGGTIEGNSAGSLVWGIADNADMTLNPGLVNRWPTPSFVFGKFSNGAYAYTGGGSVIMAWADGAGSYVGSDEPGSIIGGVATYGGQLYGSGGGSVTFGQARNGGQITANAYGSSVFGRAVGQGARLVASGSGSLASGVVNSTYVPTRIGGTGSNSGSTTFGSAYEGGSIQSKVRGAMVFGFAHGYGVENNARIEAVVAYQGADAGVMASGCALGVSAPAAILASFSGARAHGYALNHTIMAEGFGAFAGGNAMAADITASTDGAFQWGPGANNVADSLQVGSTARIEPGSVVLDKTAGTGFKVDLATPDYPWRDLIGNLVADEAGANSAVLTPYRGGLIREYAFEVNDRVDIRFHMPHDYAPGTDLFIHMHWSHNGTAITGTGTITGSVTHSYAKGFNQGSFTPEETVVITNNAVTTASVPQYRHMIEEVQLSAPGGAGGLLDTDTLEVDGLILVNFTMTAIPTITGGTSSLPFVHAIDIHYQSTSIGTSQKSFPFYS